MDARFLTWLLQPGPRFPVRLGLTLAAGLAAGHLLLGAIGWVVGRVG